MFKPGEIAIYTGPVRNNLCAGVLQTGDEVVLVQYHRFMGRWELERKATDGRKIAVKECHLRKRPYPDQFSPCEKGFNWKRPQDGMPIVFDRPKVVG